MPALGVHKDASRTAALGGWWDGRDDFDTPSQDRHSHGMDFDVSISKLLAWDSSSRACENTG